ncbi:MAG: hypothetical protein AAFQ66_22360, partial [Pseudomonadota bacterium]
MKLTQLALALSLVALPLSAQNLLHQPTSASVPTAMPADVLNRIDDPFFRIVIEADPQPTTLNDLVGTLLEGGRSDFQSFVVG